MIIDSSTLVGTTALSGSFEITGSTLPGTHTLYDFGTASKAFRNIYSTAFSGSLTKLLDGTSYLVAGSNVTITTGSSGAITIAASTASGVVTGTGTTNYVPKWSSSTALTDSVLFDAGSAIGVGTTLVGSNKLVVAGALAVSGSVEPGTDLTNNLGSSTKRWSNVYASALSGSLTKLADGTSYLIAGSNVTITTGSNGGVTIASTSALTGTGTTNYMTKWSSSTSVSNSVAYDDGTNIGIGTTTSLTARLQVSGSSTSSAQVAVLQAGVPTPSGKVLDIRNNGGSSVASIDYLGNFSGNDGTFGGNLSITGNLSVLGTQVIVDSTIVNIKDNIILVNAGPSPLSTGGIYVADTTANTTGSMIWDASTDRWRAGLVGNETNVVLTGSTDSLFNKTLTIAGSTANIISGGTVGAVGFFNSSGYLSSSAQGTSGQILQSGGSGTPTWTNFGTLLSGSTVITGSGTTNYSARFSSPNALTTGTIYDNGSAIGIGTTLLGSNTVAVAGNITVTGSIQPGITNSYNLGNVSYTWANLYSTNVYATAISGSHTKLSDGTSYLIAGSNISITTGSNGAVTIAGTSAITGTGVTNYVTKWTGTSALGYGVIYDDGTQVGIGTTSYTGRLYVSGSSTSTMPTMVVREGVVSPLGGVGTFDVQNSAGTSLLFVSGSGFVGIGTSTQNATAAGGILHVSSSLVGNAASQLVIGSQILGNSSNLYRGNFQFFQLANGTETMRIDSLGNVAIGTSVTNGNKLSVNGQTAITGSLLPGVDNTYDLGSTSKRWSNIYAVSVSGSLTGSNLLANQVVVAGTGGVLTGSSVFLFDRTNNRVGIGTTSVGSQRLAIFGATSAFGSTTFEALNSSGTSLLFVGDNGNVGINSNNPGSRLEIVGETSTAMTNALRAVNSTGSPLLTVRNDTTIGIGTDSPGYTLEVNGSFAAVTKSFVIPHPTKRGWKLRYGSLEGPENGVYVRGCSTGIIKLPDYWDALVDAESLTVQLTSIGRYQKLYVEKISTAEIVVRNASLIDRLLGFKPSFFYVVHANRKDVKFEVELDQSVEHT